VFIHAFISVHESGAYRRYQAYSVTLSDGRVVIARVARRFMPRRKTESEVATMEYIRSYTSIPVPDVYFYDSNPYNRLGGEYIIMSKVRLRLYRFSRSRDSSIFQGSGHSPVFRIPVHVT